MFHTFAHEVGDRAVLRTERLHHLLLVVLSERREHAVREQRGHLAQPLAAHKLGARRRRLVVVRQRAAAQPLEDRAAIDRRRLARALERALERLWQALQVSRASHASAAGVFGR